MRCNLLVWTLFFTALIAGPSVYSDEFIENAVQEIETLIHKNYSGRARALALKRLDALIDSQTADAERIKAINAYRQQLQQRLKKGAPVGKGSAANLPTDDSDGDGLPNIQDKNPLVADPGIVRWEFHSLTLTVAGPDNIKTTFRFIGNLYRLLENATARKRHPLSLLGLDSINSLIQSNLQLDSGITLPWGQRNRSEAQRLNAFVTAFNGKDFTAMAAVDVMFFNSSSNQNIFLKKGTIPILWQEKRLFSADCIEIEPIITLPGNSRHGTMVRFTAPLTAKLVTLIINRFEKAGPRISLPTSRLELTTADSGIKLLDAFRSMEKKTARLALRTSTGEAAWRIARNHGGKPVSVGDALQALNQQLKAFNGKTIFVHSNGEITSIAGIENSTDCSWLAYSNGTFVTKENQLNHPLPAMLTFVLVQKKMIRDDFTAIQNLRLSGKNINEYLQTIGKHHVDEWVTGVEAGWPEALFLMATCMRQEFCVRRDLRKSLRFHQLAAKRGLGASMNRLGEIYQIGNGVEMDDTRAVEWFKKAVQKNDPLGQDNLARCFYYGLGVKQDMSVAAALFRKAADSNHVLAINSLANLYLRGNGVKRDYKMAFAHFQKAADMGYGPAMTQIGSFYRLGLGVSKDFNKSFTWLKKAADANQDSAYLYLGQAYERGWGTAAAPKQAFAYYKRAYDANKPQAAPVLGRFYRDGIGCTSDINKAVACFLNGAEKGDAESIAAIGSLYLSGTGVKQNPEQGIALLEKSASSGYHSAWITLGETFEFGRVVPVSPKRALQYYQKAAAAGNINALAKVGWMYETGQGVKKDHKKALEFYRNAARKGSALAQSYLAIAYQFGHGVEKDMKQAVAWLQKAADQGDSKSLFNLAECYKTGNGVTKDMTKAYKMFMQSADLGDPKAQVEIGMMYHVGEIVPKTPKKAIIWWEKAAHQNEISAVIYLALTYERGSGVPKNKEKALFWFKKAKALGNPQGDEGISRLRE